MKRLSAVCNLSQGMSNTDRRILKTDMEEVLRLDKSNAVVKLELEELKEMKIKIDQEKKVGCPLHYIWLWI